jgi:Domain of unknown function (DUF1707)/FHA domain
MEGNPGDAAPADRPHPARYRWRPADRVRASDADRDAVISQLRERYAEGRLTHDTLDHRLEAALRARYQHDLEDVVADLPSRRRLASTVQACWHRGWTTLAGMMTGTPRSAPARVLPFPSGGQSRFTIGRDAGCDMVLPDPTISRWHAGLRREASGWVLDDLGSTNGTRLNGWRVRAWVPVRDGDVVSFGAVTYVFGRPGGGRGLSQAGG